VTSRHQHKEANVRMSPLTWAETNWLFFRENWFVFYPLIL
jgi:hypothetical protein